MNKHITDMNFEHAAVIVIDMQNDFCLPHAVMPVEGAMDVAPIVAEALDAARKVNMPVIHIVRLYNTDGSNADLCRKEQIISGLRVVEPGTKGAEILDLLKPDGCKEQIMNAELLLSGEPQCIGQNEWILYKPRWGAFYQTNLENFLKEKQIDSLIFMGINFPNCPRTSIYEASERDFRLCMVVDGMSRLYDRGIDELNQIGVAILSKNELIRQINNKKYAQNLV